MNAPEFTPEIFTGEQKNKKVTVSRMKSSKEE
jgi:hypothetical protein